MGGLNNQSEAWLIVYYSYYKGNIAKLYSSTTTPDCTLLDRAFFVFGVRFGFEV